jgi:hypothetical protein
MRAFVQRLTYRANPPALDAYSGGRLVGKIIPRGGGYHLSVDGGSWRRYKTLSSAKAALRNARSRFGRPYVAPEC